LPRVRSGEAVAVASGVALFAFMFAFAFVLAFELVFMFSQPLKASAATASAVQIARPLTFMSYPFHNGKKPKRRNRQRS
jgi:hypothetical protein